MIETTTIETTFDLRKEVAERIEAALNRDLKLSPHAAQIQLGRFKVAACNGVVYIFERGEENTIIRTEALHIVPEGSIRDVLSADYEAILQKVKEFLIPFVNDEVIAPAPSEGAGFLKSYVEATNYIHDNLKDKLPYSDRIHELAMEYARNFNGR